jgi:hypothetical protein
MDILVFVDRDDQIITFGTDNLRYIYYLNTNQEDELHRGLKAMMDSNPNPRHLRIARFSLRGRYILTNQPQYILSQTTMTPEGDILPGERITV